MLKIKVQMFFIIAAEFRCFCNSRLPHITISLYKNNENTKEHCQKALKAKSSPLLMKETRLVIQVRPNQ